MSRELAATLLSEAVFESRARQAAGAALAPGPPIDVGGCGLGEKAAVVLELSEAGRAAFDALWPEGLDEEALARVHAVVTDWVRRQDALDRKRNHFLKDFRRAHGADRRAYDGDTARAYEAGVDAVNAEVRAGLDAAADRLLAAGDPGASAC